MSRPIRIQASCDDRIRRSGRERVQHASATRVGSVASPATCAWRGRRALAIDGPTRGHGGSRRPAHPGGDGGARWRGALNQVQPIQNGPLIVSMRGELQAIDVVDGSVRSILPPGDNANGVSRSPDGRLVAFWTVGGGQSHLWVIGVDGQDRRELASDLSLGWPDAIDVWSSDSRFLATEVILGGDARIIVADVVTGAARVVTPPGFSPTTPCGLRTTADRLHQGGRRMRSLAVIRTDGSGKRTISGNVSTSPAPIRGPPTGMDLLRRQRWSGLSGQCGGRLHPAPHRGRPGGLRAGVVPRRDPDRVHRDRDPTRTMTCTSPTAMGRVASAAGTRRAHGLVGGRTVCPRGVEPGRPTRRSGRHQARWKRIPGRRTVRRRMSARRESGMHRGVGWGQARP